MTLKAKVLNLPTDLEGRVRYQCSIAEAHEDRGEYALAIDALQSVWAGPLSEPNLDQLSDETAVRVLVRAGSLTAWTGSLRQIEGWQEKAKDLLTAAATRAAARDDHYAWRDAQKCLAVCYWREGAFDEAAAVTESALVGAQPANELTSLLKLNLALIARSRQRHEEAIEILLEAAPAIEESARDNLKFKLHNGLGTNYKALGAFDKAIIELTAASYYLEQLDHKPFLVGVAINLANALVQAGRFDEAHEQLSKAETLAADIGDAVHLAQAKDSRALAFLAEQNYVAAERAANESVSILQNGDEHALFCDSLLTHARALCGLKENSAALRRYLQAHEIAESRIGSVLASRIAIEIISELAGEACLSGQVTLDEAIEVYEASIIRSALVESSQRVSAAAIRLGVKQQTLSNILNTRHEGLHPGTRLGRPRKTRPKQAEVLKMPERTLRAPSRHSPPPKAKQ